MMHQRFIEWQQDAALDSQIWALIVKRKDKRREIYYHQHYLLAQETVCAQIRNHLYRSMKEYEEIDLQLAQIDGRLSFVRMEKTKKREKKRDKTLSNLSVDQLTELITQLEAMK